MHENGNTPTHLPYEPPKIQDLGTLVDLTAGTGQPPGTDVSGTST